MSKIEYIELNNSRFYSETESEIIGTLEEEFKNSESYKKLKEKQDGIQQILANALPRDLRTILVEYYDITLEVLILQQVFYYRNGFIDGARLINALMGVNEVNCVIKLGEA